MYAYIHVHTCNETLTGDTRQPPGYSRLFTFICEYLCLLMFIRVYLRSCMFTYVCLLLCLFVDIFIHVHLYIFMFFVHSFVVVYAQLQLLQATGYVSKSI